ncbi:hypothetical protein PFICI_10872 [Pestalotiopsis fici W106-1]|uniref:Uncharacterized protein n=1 Tax=Pestalotiopsis fici (strain W106-1 / CGMCC3.15140) TaxID=1229662 RepID=W3WSZ4_PESFW|nr:uncharacterized protein PFICI_10872 [Pestalotiopsis fici W106-1]ETS76998.1 hypothetical protein PFICI_10872 [Pestalotiopsis fici W106-1]
MSVDILYRNQLRATINIAHSKYKALSSSGSDGKIEFDKGAEEPVFGLDAGAYSFAMVDNVGYGFD